MLRAISYLPVRLALGCYKIPKGSHIVGSHAVCDTKTGHSGILVQFEETGIYRIFSAGAVCGVDPYDVRHMLLTQ